MVLDDTEVEGDFGRWQLERQVVECMAGMDMYETIAQPESPTCIKLKRSNHIVLQFRKVWRQGRENRKRLRFEAR